VYLGLAAGFIVPVANSVIVWLLQRAAPVGNWRTFLSAFPSRLLMPEQEVARSEAAPPSIFPLFDVNGYVISQVTYLGILMTYGVVFPPLAVVMCATMLSVAWQAKLSLGRFLHFTREQGAPQLAEALDRVCKGAVSMNLLRSSIFLITSFACCFYALFLFDTLGDAVSLSGAYWVLIAMPLLPVVLYGPFNALQAP
jgi:hypothetical protein